MSWVTFPLTSEAVVSLSLMPGLVSPLVRWPASDTSLPSRVMLLEPDTVIPGPVVLRTAKPRMVTQLRLESLKPYEPPTTDTTAPGASVSTMGAAAVPEAATATSPP